MWQVAVEQERAAELLYATKHLVADIRLQPINGEQPPLLSAEPLLQPLLIGDIQGD